MIKRLRAYKTKLILNNKERTWCKQCAGASRWCYNWGLAAMIEAYGSERKTSVLTEKKRLNAIKDDIAPWLRDLPYVVLQESFRNLDTAYKNFFRRVKQNAKAKGFPKFKSRKNARQSFRVRSNLHVTDTHIKVPRFGWLRLAEHGYLPKDGRRIKMLSATISTRNGGATWGVSLQVEEQVPEPAPATGPVLGIDLGIHALAVVSDGTVYENVKPLRTIERKIGMLSRELARRKKGSANWGKTKTKLNKSHAKARHIRRNYLHAITSETVQKNPSAVVMEDLNVQGMMSNRHLSRAIADLGMYELRRQMTYKTEWNGSAVVLASRWYPSSKTCSQCGAIKSDLTLSDREYRCAECGAIIDRDLNAAINLSTLTLA